jgi:hypothetical protein
MSAGSDSESSTVRDRGHVVRAPRHAGAWSAVTGLLSVAALAVAMTSGVAEAQEPAPGPALDTPEFEHGRTFQTLGGKIRFTLAGDAAALPTRFRGCLRWKRAGGCSGAKPCDDASSTSVWVRRVEDKEGTPGGVYEVTLPDALQELPKGQKYQGYGVLGIVSAAELDLRPSTGAIPEGWPFVRDIGVTSVRYAAFNAIVAILLAGWLLNSFAQYLGVPGPADRGKTVVERAARGFSVPLRLISTASGWASLSQLQIVLWTFVIGAGAIYVMTLNGSLIPISTGTLALLGIAGGAVVLSEVKNQQSDSSTVAPAVVTGIGVANETDSEMTVSWSPPQGTAPPLVYLIQYKDSSGTWHTVSRDLRATKVRIVGLQPSTEYEVRIVASNVAGSGPEATIKATTTAAVAQGTPVSGLGTNIITPTKISLGWASATGNATYRIEQRRHDGDDAWVLVKEALAATTVDIDGLSPATDYDVRVRMDSVVGVWSPVMTVRTAVQARTPRWSDVVTDADRPGQIDVTRVQMLFFTVISAVFVSLSIIRSGTIPDIPGTYVGLMGISNGLYVTAKFIR